MTYNPVSEQVMTETAGVVGFQSMMAEDPPEVTEVVNGGGTATYNTNGLLLNPGTTASDYVKAEVPEMENLNNAQLDLRLEFLFRMDGTITTPYTDEAILGMSKNFAPEPSTGMVLDLSGPEYNVNGVTSPASLGSEDSLHYLGIECRFDDSETVFYQQGNGVSERVVINDRVSNQDLGTIAASTSNGAGEDLEVYFFRMAVIKSQGEL